MTQGPGGRTPPAPPAPPEPEAPTTFCALLPRMPQWKFAAPAGFLGRGPAAARAAGGAGAADSQPEPAGPASVPALAAAVLGACEPRCAAPCPLPALSRCRAAGGRGPRGARGAAGPADASADEWIRKGSFIHKPAHGWLHPDARVLGPGVSYIVRYMGCIEVLRSMRSLDFNTRTQVTREAINRLHEAVPGIRGSWKKKAPNKALASILGKSNLRFAGMSIAVSISTDGLNLSVPATRQVIANHHMQSISFASGGDTDMTDYVAYVAKDPINQRACHILECCEGLAQSIISTVGQAFELRFKQYLHSPPRVVLPPERLTRPEESAWGDEEETEHNYYNSIPGKEPPLGGLVDSRLALTQPCAVGALGQGVSPARKDTRSLPWDLGPSGPPGDGYVQADARGPRDYEDHLYVNTQGLDAPEPLQPEDSPKKDLFDMRGSCQPRLLHFIFASRTLRGRSEAARVLCGGGGGGSARSPGGPVAQPPHPPGPHRPHGGAAAAGALVPWPDEPKGRREAASSRRGLPGARQRHQSRAVRPHRHARGAAQAPATCGP
ncbi:SHC-transforming protein 2 isoform X2 [Panthera leo]|uniref:SHC-transforming protein 2 isoform X2 n=1 Tax=Panthera leo TaxID=9689 RepID=UPI001C69DFA2|nr:SHC-transforming protein 2 isoform X2 [Panthera leo]